MFGGEIVKKNFPLKKFLDKFLVQDKVQDKVGLRNFSPIFFFFFAGSLKMSCLMGKL